MEEKYPFGAAPCMGAQVLQQSEAMEERAAAFDGVRIVDVNEISIEGFIFFTLTFSMTDKANLWLAHEYFN